MKDLKPPKWMTLSGIDTLSRGYLLQDETIEDACWRICTTAANNVGKPELAKKFFEYSYEKGWLCFSSPVWSNTGTTRGTSISCFAGITEDSLKGIYDSYAEMSQLTKGGGGIGWDWSNIRPTGSPIKNNGSSSGIIPWLKINDSMNLANSQGNVRRGNSTAFLDVHHKDLDQFLNMRLPKGDPDRQCLNLHHSIKVDDKFFELCEKGSEEHIKIWKRILDLRFESGEPFIFHKDNVLRQDPEWYKIRGLSSKHSNLCQEIILHSDNEHTFVCCLSSLNLEKYDEWKDSDLVYHSIFFLDGIMQDFINTCKYKPGYEKAIRFAEKSRALGLGVLGWHSFLQKKMLPFESIAAYSWNKIIFEDMKEKSNKATRDLAGVLGEPEWCRGFGIRNSHCLALAPTVTNATIAGDVSPSIEPNAANIFMKNTAKGNFLIKNKYLEKLLESKGKNTDTIWNDINSDKGSVSKLDFLNELEKEVFKTAREINQFAIIKQAGDRQKFIDQGVSLNLFFSYPEGDNIEQVKEDLAQYAHDVHKAAFLQYNLKTLYYLRSESATKGDVLIRKETDCQNCEG